MAAVSVKLRGSVIDLKICVPLVQQKKYLLGILNKTVDFPNKAPLNEQHCKVYYRTDDLP